MIVRSTAQGRARRLAAAVGGHRRWILATAGLATIASGAGLGLIGLAAHLISRSAMIDTTTSVALLIVGVRFFAVVRVVARYLERMVGHLATFTLLTRIRVWFFARALPVAPRGLLDRRTGELLTTILDDVDTMQLHYLRVLVPPIVAGATIVLACAIEGAFSPAAALAVALCALGAGLVVPALVRRSQRGSLRRVSELRAESSARIHEAIAARREIVAFGAQDRMRRSLLDIDRAQLDARRRLTRARALAGAAIASFASGAGLAALALAIPLVRSGQLDPQLLAVLPLVAIACFEVIGPLAEAVEARERSDAAADRLLTITELPPTVREPDRATPIDRSRRAPSDPPALVARDLEYGFDDLLVRGLDLDAPPGSVVTISGPSGCGKSTLLDLLLRFGDFGGSLRIDDVELGSMASADARRFFASVRQHDHVFDSTVRDNLLLADPDADDDRMLATLATVGLGEFVERVTDPLGTRTGTDGDRLSGGERQRLLLARALLADRPILLLDEAFEHLEPRLRQRVRDSVLDASPGRTVVLVEHDIDATSPAPGSNVMSISVTPRAASTTGGPEQLETEQLETEQPEPDRIRPEA